MNGEHVEKKCALEAELAKERAIKETLVTRLSDLCHSSTIMQVIIADEIIAALDEATEGK